MDMLAALSFCLIVSFRVEAQLTGNVAPERYVVSCSLSPNKEAEIHIFLPLLRDDICKVTRHNCDIAIARRR